MQHTPREIRSVAVETGRPREPLLLRLPRGQCAADAEMRDVSTMGMIKNMGIEHKISACFLKYNKTNIDDIRLETVFAAW